MTRGDDTAAAHIPTQPSASDDPAGFASTSGPPDDFADSDVAPRRSARRSPPAEPETDPAVDSDVAPEVSAPAESSGLDDRSKEILAFERRWWRQAGSKE